MGKTKVRLFHQLRTIIGQSEIEIQANTLSDVLNELMAKSHSVKDILFDSRGTLQSYFLIYVNNRVQNPPDLSRKLTDGDLILLIPTTVGG